MTPRQFTKNWTRFVAMCSLFGTLFAVAVPARSQSDTSNEGSSFTQRVALVIGNDAYLHVSPLEKAANDARAVGSALWEKHNLKLGY